eukprot:m.32709 g.32709  ORF g.32709 m.32709 type:complete len:79 (+) comp16681_c1_seq1:77-313(+)
MIFDVVKHQRKQTQSHTTHPLDQMQKYVRGSVCMCVRVHVRNDANVYTSMIAYAPTNVMCYLQTNHTRHQTNDSEEHV